jgi:hypothetical protein
MPWGNDHPAALPGSLNVIEENRFLQSGLSIESAK